MTLLLVAVGGAGGTLARYLVDGWVSDLTGGRRPWGTRPGTRIEGPALLLRVYVGESDRWEGRPLYEAVVHLLRERGVAGATVLRGIEGYGGSARLHATRVLRLSEDQAVLIEVVDQEDRLRAVLPELDRMVRGGLMTLETVEVLAYRSTAEEAG